MVGNERKVKGLCRNTVTDDGGVDWGSQGELFMGSI
jgi:hypothetical protein